MGQVSIGAERLFDARFIGSKQVRVWMELFHPARRQAPDQRSDVELS